ncbi:MAG: hypothetical protein ACTSPY_05945 [Candidatus Helarchaeota archaeon]
MELLKNVSSKVLDSTLDLAFMQLDMALQNRRAKHVKMMEATLKKRYEILKSTNWLIQKKKYPTMNDMTELFTSEEYKMPSLNSLSFKIRHLLENYGYLIKFQLRPLDTILKMTLLENRHTFKMFIIGNKKFLKKYLMEIFILLEGIIYYDPNKDTSLEQFPLKSELLLTISHSSYKGITIAQMQQEYEEIIEKIQNIFSKFGFTILTF